MDTDITLHITLQMIAKHGTKLIPVRVDPGTDVNTIPLSKYRKLFWAHFRKARNLKQKAIQPTKHMWTVHDNTQTVPWILPN